MAYANILSGRHPERTGRLATTINEISARWSAYRVYRRTLDELRSLSDRDLNDLGLSRFNIREVAREAAYGEHA